jgi:transposase
MDEVATIGLDLAKHVFQVHGIDAEGELPLRCGAANGRGVPNRPKGARCQFTSCASGNFQVPSRISARGR